jgi:hypothetical protein
MRPLDPGLSHISETMLSEKLFTPFLFTTGSQTYEVTGELDS